MKKEVFNGDWYDYTFRADDGEVIDRIYDCLVKTNPELRKKDIRRSKYSREYEARYFKRNGEPVSMSIGVRNLKRYFGAFILAFEEKGIRFVRRTKRKLPKTEVDFEDGF